MPPRLAERPILRKKLMRRLRAEAPPPMRQALIDEARRPPREGSPHWRWGIAITGAIASLQLGMAAVDELDGAPLGETCDVHHDCASSLCLVHLPSDARYCSKPCEDDVDCAPDHHCGSAAELPRAQRGIGAAGPLASGPVCVDKRGGAGRRVDDQTADLLPTATSHHARLAKVDGEPAVDGDRSARSRSR